MAFEGVSKPEELAPIIIVNGDAGSGKTSLANSMRQWGKVIFARAEDVSGVFDSLPAADRPDVFPVLPRADKKRPRATSDALLNQLDDLLYESHDYAVLAIDTVTSMDDLLQHEVLTHLGGENLAVAGGGYGAGWQSLADTHAEIIAKLLEIRRKKDMVIMPLMHQKVEKVRFRPDAEEAIVFGFEMHEKVHHLWRKHADAVLFTRMDSFTKGVQTDNKGIVRRAGKVISSGDRSIITSADGGQGYLYAKNRYDMPPELAFPKDDPIIMDYIDWFKNQ